MDHIKDAGCTVLHATRALEDVKHIQKNVFLFIFYLVTLTHLKVSSLKCDEQHLHVKMYDIPLNE